MDKNMIAENVIREMDGIAKAADFFSNGLYPNDLISLCKDGIIEKIRHGYYSMPKIKFISEEKILSRLLPEGIICLESALFYYGYSDFTPRSWSIAVPRSISRTRLKIDKLPLKVYYVNDNMYSIGCVAADFNGITLNIYDRERTICDCFKYKSKMDSETFNKAVKAYANDKEKNIENLSKYSKHMKVYKKVNELMGVLLNG